MLDLKTFIRDIPDFPKPGILFRDITPLLGNPDALRETVRRLADPYRKQKINAVVAAEARGFIFAAPMAIELSAESSRWIESSEWRPERWCAGAARWQQADWTARQVQT